jgi:peptidase E
MKLFLASEVKHPDTIAELKQFIGGFRGKKIAYVPTAANGEESFGSWQQGGTWQLVQTLGADVTPIQLEDYKNSSVIDLFRGRDILWFAGGYPGYLMYWIRRCQLDKVLPELLKTSLYVGSSAGGMVTAPDIKITEWYSGEEEYGAGVIPGLSLVNFDVWPHYEENMLPDIKKHYRGKKLYLLKNGEEVIVEDAIVKVIGEERIFTPQV